MVPAPDDPDSEAAFEKKKTPDEPDSDEAQLWRDWHSRRDGTQFILALLVQKYNY